MANLFRDSRSPQVLWQDADGYSWQDWGLQYVVHKEKAHGVVRISAAQSLPVVSMAVDIGPRYSAPQVGSISGAKGITTKSQANGLECRAMVVNQTVFFKAKAIGSELLARHTPSISQAVNQSNKYRAKRS
jgi:hypothetical protein